MNDISLLKEEAKIVGTCDVLPVLQAILWSNGSVGKSQIFPKQETGKPKGKEKKKPCTKDIRKAKLTPSINNSKPTHKSAQIAQVK